ncbi:MAG: flagellar assembly protein FliW, partial [Candidatus Zixiibacteriota bacterium]
METVRINTTRFGEIEAPPERVISMEKPVLGFEGRRLFIIIEHNDMFPFVWLQSLEVADLAFLMVNPALFLTAKKLVKKRKKVE